MMTLRHCRDDWNKGVLFSGRVEPGNPWFYIDSEGERVGPFRSKWSAIRARWFATCDGCGVFYVSPEEAALCQRYADDVDAGTVEAHPGFPPSHNTTTEPGFYYGHDLNDTGCSTLIGLPAPGISIEVASPGNPVAFGPFATAEIARQAAAAGALSCGLGGALY